MTAKDTRNADRTRNHTAKPEPVHVRPRRHPATNHDTTSKPQNSKGHRYHGNQPRPTRPSKTPDTRTEPENTRRKPVQSTQAPTATRPAATPVPQTRGIPRIPQHHKGQPPAHQPRNHPSPRTEPEITSRNRNQSIPKPVCTGAANHRTTAKPRNTKYLLAELQSSTAKSAAQPARATDRTGKHQLKTSPVHTGTDRYTPNDHIHATNRKTPTAHEHHEDHPPTHQPPRQPVTFGIIDAGVRNSV